MSAEVRLMYAVEAGWIAASGQSAQDRSTCQIFF